MAGGENEPGIYTAAGGAKGRHLKSSNSTSVENSTDNEQSEIDRIAVANSKFRHSRALFPENLAILTGISGRIAPRHAPIIYICQSASALPNRTSRFPSTIPLYLFTLLYFIVF